MPDDLDCRSCTSKSKKIKDLEKKLEKAQAIVDRQTDLVLASVAYEQMAIEVLQEIGIDLIPEQSSGKGKNYAIKAFYRCRACHLKWEEKEPPKHEPDCRLDEVIVQSDKQL